MRLFVILCFTIATFTAPAFATELLNENFDGYADGEIPAPWVKHSGTDGELPLIASGEAVLSGTNVRDADVNAPLTGGPYGDGTEFFAGFTVRVTSVPPSSGYFTHAKPATTTYRGRVFVTAGGVADTVRFGIANTGSAADQIFPLDIDINTDATVIVRITQSGGACVCTLWVNPVDVNSTSVTAGDVSSAENLTSWALRQSSNMGDSIIMDDLVVATTFAEVVPTAPVSLTMATDNPTPANETVAPDASDVVVGTFTAAAAGGTATITQIELAAGGSADPVNDIASNGVTIYRDTNGNDSYDAGTDQAVASGSYTVAGNLILTGLSNNAINDGITGRFFVVYNLAGSASQGETFTATTTITADVTVTGDNPSTSRTIEMTAVGGGGNGGTIGGGGGGCNVAGAPGSAFPAILLALLIGLVAIRRAR